MTRVRVGMVGVGMIVATALGCSGWLARSEGLDPATLPENVRGDYAVFAQRCSKCHSLARPLSSGIDDDEYWAMYVARMRRQPSSGISQEDTVVVLRFLHYFSEDIKAKKAKRDAKAVKHKGKKDAGKVKHKGKKAKKASGDAKE